MKNPAPPSRAEFHEAISNPSDRWYAACLKITRNQHLADEAFAYIDKMLASNRKLFPQVNLAPSPYGAVF